MSRLSQRKLGNGTWVEVTYDARSRVTGIALKKPGATLRQHTYGYNAVSNVTSHSVAGVTTTYGYDLADQLISESRLGYVASYTYDANGNRATRTVNGQTETYVNDAADKLTSISIGGNTVRSFTYDGRGRRKTDTYAGSTTTYSWDAESRLTSLARPGVTTSSFGYNGLDARVSKTDSGGTFNYKRNGAGVTDPVLSDGAATYTPGISERRAGSSKFLHSGMKNADAQSGASANVDSSRTYDAFGNLTGSVGTWSGPFGYAGGFGYQEDPDHGLRLLGHRYYDSSTGRFISKDPAGAGRNWTTYAGNDPTRYTDPVGLSGIDSVSNNPQTAGWALAEINGVAAPTVASVAAADTLTFAGLSITARASAVLARLDAAMLSYLMRLPPAVLKVVLECFDEFEALAQQSAMGPMSGARGSVLHGEIARRVSSKGGGEVSVFVERSFNGGKDANYGSRGSIRYDVIIKWKGGSLVLDWKFGKKLLDEARKRQLEEGLPPSFGPTSVIGVPAKGVRSGFHSGGRS